MSARAFLADACPSSEALRAGIGAVLPDVQRVGRYFLLTALYLSLAEQAAHCHETMYCQLSQQRSTKDD